jgi:hypothetical protein
VNVLHDAARQLVDRYRELSHVATGPQVQSALDAVGHAVVAVERAEKAPDQATIENARACLAAAEAAVHALATSIGKK